MARGYLSIRFQSGTHAAQQEPREAKSGEREAEAPTMAPKKKEAKVIADGERDFGEENKMLQKKLEILQYRLSTFSVRL